VVSKMMTRPSWDATLWLTLVSVMMSSIDADGCGDAGFP
jgi:hypothetical protein